MEGSKRQYLDNPKHRKQLNNEENNPCFKEQTMSYNCLEENHYDADMCQKHFQNYKMCKSFWNSVRSYRRSNGIRPLLPPEEERAQIKEKFLSTGRL